ncbi:hypothetical protein IG631_21492 [Alternaria alternata]|nr:hypothetical protein IG631_21492 [Alternaria alternata]
MYACWQWSIKVPRYRPRETRARRRYPRLACLVRSPRTVVSYGVRQFRWEWSLRGRLWESRTRCSCGGELRLDGLRVPYPANRLLCRQFEGFETIIGLPLAAILSRGTASSNVFIY